MLSYTLASSLCRDLVCQACLSPLRLVTSALTLQVIVTDTAGLRDTSDPIEAEGVALAQEAAQQADLVMSVLDCTALDIQPAASPTAAPADPNSSPNRPQLQPQQTPHAASADPSPSLPTGVLTYPSGLAATSSQAGPQNTSSISPLGSPHINLFDVDSAYAQTPARVLTQLPAGNILVLNKADALSPEALAQLQQQLHMSAKQSQSASPAQDSPDATCQTLTSNQAVTAQSGAPDQRPWADASELLQVLSAQGIGAPASELHDPRYGFGHGLQRPSRVVLCSCKTGLQMHLLTEALEEAVQDVMQQGQESAEGFAITRSGTQACPGLFLCQGLLGAPSLSFFVETT